MSEEKASDIPLANKDLEGEVNDEMEGFDPSIETGEYEEYLGEWDETEEADEDEEDEGENELNEGFEGDGEYEEEDFDEEEEEEEEEEDDMEDEIDIDENLQQMQRDLLELQLEEFQEEAEAEIPAPEIVPIPIQEEAVKRKESEDIPDPTSMDYYFIFNDPKDPDKFLKLKMAQGEKGEGDETNENLEMNQIVEAEFEVDSLADIEGIVGITLSENTKTYLGLDELLAEPKQKFVWLNWKKIKLHMFTHGEESEFFPHYEAIKYYPDLAMLLGVDFKKQTEHEYFLCLTTAARNRVLNPPKEKKVYVDLKKKEEEKWNEMASIAPRKWKGFASELEVDEEKVFEGRPLITVQVNRLRTFFGDSIKFQDTNIDDPNFYVSFDSEDPSLYPSIQTLETDRGIQVVAPTKASSTQTGLSFKRSKMVQHSTQSISDENVDVIMKSKSMAKFFKSSLSRLEKVLQQNEMVDLLFDDYKNLKNKNG